MATTSTTGNGPFNTRPRFPSSNSGSIPRSTSSSSSSTLPSIRSFRKAFQFTSSNNSNSNSKRASVDSYLNGSGGALRSASASTAAEVAAQQLRKSNGTGRTFSGGSLPRPVIELTTDGIAKSAAVGNVPALTGSGTSPGPVAVNKTDIPDNRTDEVKNAASELENTPTPTHRVLEIVRPRAVSAYTMPMARQSHSSNSSTVYSSNIPVNRRPLSASTSRSSFSQQQPLQSLDPKQQRRISPGSLSSALEQQQQGQAATAGRGTEAASQAAVPAHVSLSEVHEQVNEDELLSMPVMHILNIKSATPPPILPLPPIPAYSKDDNASERPRTTGSINSTTLSSNSKLFSQSRMNKNDLTLDIPATHPTKSDQTASTVSKTVAGATTISSASLFDEPAPDALNDISITSPAAAVRPTIARSRSAIDSIKAMAAEVDIFNNNNNKRYPGSGHSPAALNDDTLNMNTTGGGRSRQSSLPKPMIMDSPSRSPAVVDANKIFVFPNTGGKGVRDSGMNASSAEIVWSSSSSSSPTIPQYGSTAHNEGGSALNSSAVFPNTGGKGVRDSGMNASSAEIVWSSSSSSSPTIPQYGSTAHNEGGSALNSSAGTSSSEESGSNNNNQNYLSGVRHSSTSPLSELVQRLSVQAGSVSPTKERGVSPVALYSEEMDTSDLRSEEDDPSEAHYRSYSANAGTAAANGFLPSSPFIPRGMLDPDTEIDQDEEEGLIDDGSVAGSSGISAVRPSRLPASLLPRGQSLPHLSQQRQQAQDAHLDYTHAQQQQNSQSRGTFERVSGRKVEKDPSFNTTPQSNHITTSNSDLTASDSRRSTQLQDFANRISPQTEKRWSMAEVEAAYGRIRKLATRRSSAAVSEAPSFLISEDSKDMAPSYVQHLIDRGYPLDSSMSSSPSQGLSSAHSDTGHAYEQRNIREHLHPDISLSESIDPDEAGDALTPLVGRNRFSPNTSPRNSTRSLSPHMYDAQPSSSSIARSKRNSLVESRADSPYSSGTGSSSLPKSNGSAALTAPTTARLSMEEVRKTSDSGHAKGAPAVARSLSDQQDRISNKAHGIDGGWQKRRTSVAGSSATTSSASAAGSDDTGWVTPKTSAGDPMHIHQQQHHQQQHGERRSSISPAITESRRPSTTMDHYDDVQHHTFARKGSAARQTKRPVSYSSSGGTDSAPISAHQQNRSGSFRHINGPSHSASHSSLWFDDTPKAAHTKSRPGIPSDFRGSAAHPHRREASSYSTAGSTYSLDSLSTGAPSFSFADAKRADKIDLFLRCTKAESALHAITTQSQIEKEALLDALQESRAIIENLREQNEDLAEQLDYARRSAARKPPDQVQENARRIAEIVEARDEWQARAQAMERDLAATKQTHQQKSEHSEAAHSDLRKEILRLQEMLSARSQPKSPQSKSAAGRGSSLPRRSSPGNTTLKTSMSPSGLPRSTYSINKNSLPRSRHSSGTNSIGFSPHGRTTSNASSTFQTDFGDHLPASSDNWSLSESQNASLRLDDSTAKFLQDIDGQSARSRQRSNASST